MQSSRPGRGVGVLAASLLFWSGLACRTTPIPAGPPQSALVAPPAPAPVPIDLEDPPPRRESRAREITQTSSLGDLLAHGLSVHPELAAQRELEVAATERARIAGTFDDPRLSVRWFFEEIETRTGPQEWAVGLQQALPGWGKRERRERAALADADTERARYAELRAGLAFQLQRGWCELYYLERARELLTENRDLIERLGEIVRTRYAVGESSYSDLTRTRIELARTRNRLEDVVDRMEPVRAELNALLYREPDAPLPQPSELPALQLEVAGLEELSTELLNELESSNPSLARLRTEREAADAMRAIADVASRPDLQLGVEYIRTGEAIDPLTPNAGEDPVLASLTFNLPLRSSRYSAMRREARALLRSAHSRLEARGMALRASLEEGLYTWRDAERSYRLHAEELVPQAEQLLEATETSYRSGRASFLEWVDAERSRLDFELGLERARTDQALAVARLQRLLGRDPEGVPDAPTTREQELHR